jgi:hypothetical protein
LPNRPEFFGEQFVVDAEGEFIRTDPRLLLTSTSLSIDAIFRGVRALGGIVIPAHVDRTAYGLLPTLGLISDEWNLPALEISRHTTPEEAVAAFPALQKYPLIQNGDVHRLDEFAGTTLFALGSPTIAELQLAFRHIGGRGVCIKPGTIR